MNILDCTLRDGGYYNNWDFEEVIVESYLSCMSEANIDYVELGLRNFPQDHFLGAFAYTTEDFINSLKLPVGPKYGVMVDAKTILESKISVIEAIDSLFVPAHESKIDLVRIAAHFKEVEYCSEIVRYLKKLGYTVGLNLMQAGGKSDELISNKALQINDWNVLDVLYFADSLGNMNETEVLRVISALRAHWKGEIGIHTHNNMGKGLANSMTAKKSGVTWVDSTITGMGRGAGNTQTECLLAVLEESENNYSPKPVYELVIRYFEKMQKEYGWGSNLLYFLGAQNDVHPTYIQNLLSNTHYGTNEIIGAINYLSQLEGTTSYNGSVLNSALNFYDNKHDEVSGSNDIIKLFDNKNILILANSPYAKKYSSAIETYIKVRKPLVISINIPKYISENLVNYYVISHNSKFLSEYSLYKNLKKPVILPKCRFTTDELLELQDVEMIDYGFKVDKETFTINGSYVTAPYDTTASYILGALLESSVNSISVIGFDGYPQGDIRQQEMIDILNFYNTHPNSVNITSLTPTSYPISKGSVYAPIKTL